MATTVAELMVSFGSSGVGSVKGDINSVGQSVDQSAAKTKLLGGALAGLGVGILGTFVGATNAAMGFESGMSNVAASLGGVGGAAGITEVQFAALGDEAMRIGAETAYSAGEAAAAMDVLAKAGVSAADIVGGVAQASVDLAAAIGESVPQSAEAVAAAMALYGLEAGDAANITDTFTAAINASQTDLTDFNAGIRNLAPAVIATGMSFEESAAAIAYFTGFGLKGADVGVSLTRAIENLGAPTAEAAAEMARLGISAFDLNGEFVGLPGLADQLKVAFAGMSEEQRIQALTTIFGAEAADVMAIAMQQGGDALREMTAEMAPNGQAAKQAQQRMDNLSGAVEELKGSFETALIVIGTKFIPMFRKLAEALTAGVNMFLKLPAPIQTVLVVAAGLVGVFASVAGAILLIAGPIAIGVAALGGMTGITATLGAAFAVLTGPIGLVVLALVGLYAAYQTNFLGFGDGVRMVAGWIGDAIGAVVEAFSRVMNYLTAVATGGDYLVSRLDRIPGPLQGIAVAVGGVIVWFQGLMDKIGILTTMFTGMQQYGVAPVEAGLRTLERALEMLGVSSGTAATVVDTLRVAFDLAVIAVRAIVGAFADVALAIPGLIALIQGIPAAITDMATMLWQKGVEIIAGFLAGAQAKWVEVSTWLLALPAAFLASFVGPITTLWQTGVDMITGLYNGAVETWTTIVVPWLTGLALAAGVALVGAATWFWQTGVDMMTGLYNGAVEAWTTTVLPWITGLALAAGVAVVGAALWLVQAGRDIITGIYNGAVEYWTTVMVPWLSGLGLAAALAVVGAALWLVTAGANVITGLYNGATSYWTGTVVPWLADLGPKTLTTVGDLSATIVSRGTELMTGLWNGITTKWDGTVRPNLVNTGKAAATAVGDLGETLVMAGRALLTGLKNGINEKWTGTVSPWLVALGVSVVNTVGDLTAILYAAGQAVMTGLWNGIRNYYDGTVQPMLANTGNAVTNAVGDLSGALVAAGAAIMTGLKAGIDSAGQAAVDAASDWASAAMNTILGIVKPGSPSRVTTPWGAAIMDGLTLGMNQTGARAVATARSWGDEVARTIRATADAASAEATRLNIAAGAADVASRSLRGGTVTTDPSRSLRGGATTTPTTAAIESFLDNLQRSSPQPPPYQVPAPVYRAPAYTSPSPSYVPPYGGSPSYGGGASTARAPITVTLSNVFHVTGGSASDIADKVKEIVAGLPDATAKALGAELALRGC